MSEPSTAFPRVAVVSPMGLERSGLAITIERYCRALRLVGVGADGYIVGSPHPEHGATPAIPTLEGLRLRIDRDGAVGVVLWVGIDSDSTGLEAQLAAMRGMHELGWRHLVVPERTGRPSEDDYEPFIGLVRERVVSGLVLLNASEERRWRVRVKLPMCVAGPPLPSSLFNVAAKRSTGDQVDRQAAVVFVGRLSRRKGFDRLRDWWPRWRAVLLESGVEATLFLYGRTFPLEADGLAGDRWIAHQGGVRWAPRFPLPNQMLAWPSTAIGVAVSRQEFDGIAVTELLASGLPVLATPTSGHLAISEESSGVTIVDGSESFASALVALATDPCEYARRSAQATAGMERTRSMVSVGQRLADFLTGVG